ncbi:MAG: ATP-dependent DNA ligase [Candidatus Woesearchaeota archaeon]
MEYETLVNIYEKIHKTSKRLEKISILAEFLLNLKKDEIYNVMLLLKGRVFEDWKRQEIGISSKFMLKVISLSSGLSINEIITQWKKEGDLGITSMKILSKNQQKTLFNKKLMVDDVVNDLRKISNLSGKGSSELKIKLLSKLLSNANNLEIKYIVRTVLEDLRTGASDGVIRDAIKLAFINEEENSTEILQNAIDLTSDISEVALLAKKGINELKNIKPIIYKPLKLMLFPKTNSFEDVFKNLGKKCAFEYKYDGFRVQIHKGKDGIKIFTRRLENVTYQFPDIVNYAQNNIEGENYIVDCEIVGYDSETGEYLPFQSISQRIKRKYNIDEISKKFPIEVVVFDIIYHNNNSFLKVDFEKRRTYLNSIIKDSPKKLILSKYIVTDNLKVANSFYKKSLKEGFEGVMAKSLSSKYIPGRKVGAGFKLKPIMQELDLVITKAEWGTGKRSRWLTSFTLSCIDEDNNLLEIGKVSSGLKEIEAQGLSYQKMTELIQPLIIKEKDKIVEIKPNLIIEVNYEEIQKSSFYSSGYALRFPRIIRLREDKGLDELSDINQIDKLYNEQKGKS